MVPIPLHVLTGFLGSGKTSLLAHLLRAPGGERIAVLVNEVGDLPIDGHLLERVDDDLLMLPSGCVCCTLRDELGAAIARVAARQPTRIVLETTGLADPAPILDGLASDPRLRSLVRLGGVLAVVDCARAEELLDEQPELAAQLEFADRVALTKTDLVPQRIATVRARLESAAPGREVREAPHGRVDAAWAFAAAPLARLRDAADARAWLHHRAPRAFRTRAVSTDEPADVDAVQLWLRLVTQLDGPRLLRIKALVECRASGDVWILQAAGRSLSPPRRLERRPAGVRGVRAVIIERGMPDTALERMIAALEEAARVPAAVSLSGRPDPVRGGATT